MTRGFFPSRSSSPPVPSLHGSDGPWATELLQAGIPADVNDRRVAHHVWLTGFIFISAVFVSLGIKNIGDKNETR
jgi:hypothetical protein